MRHGFSGRIERAILKRTEKAIIRAMCGIKLRKLDSLGLEETLHGLAKANGMRWYGGGEVLRDNDDVLRALDFDVIGQPKTTERQVV